MALTKVKSPGIDTNIDIAGTLDVTSTAVFDNNITVGSYDNAQKYLRLNQGGIIINSDTSDDYGLSINALGGTNKITLDGDGTSYFAGDMGIGAATTGAFGSRRNLTLANGTTGATLSLYNNATATNNPRISSNPGGSEINDLGLHAASTNGTIQFYTNSDTERMRIASDGTTFVGATSIDWANATSTGFGLYPAAATYWLGIKNSSGSTATNTAFQITYGTDTTAKIYNNGTATFDGTITCNNNPGAVSGPGAKLDSSGYIGVRPTNADDQIWWGYNHDTSAGTPTSSIFGNGNAYFAGGVSVGGTGAANTLDDYEEGTYDASITMGTSGTVTMNGSYDTLSYTKVGRIVHITGQIRVSSVSSPVGGTLIPLPFTALNSTINNRVGGVISQYRSGRTPVYEKLLYQLNESTSQILIQGSSSDYVVPQASDEYAISVSYLVA